MRQSNRTSGIATLILRWTILAAWVGAGLFPLAMIAEDLESCGPEIKGKDRKSVVVVEALEAQSTEEALQIAEQEAGRSIEIAFQDRYLTEDARVAKMVQKDAAKRGCEVAIITNIDKQQIGQRPRRVGAATIGEAVFRHDATVHYGRFAEP